MPLFPLPSASEIRLNSRLAPAQINPLFPDTTAFESDISDRTQEAATEVEERLTSKAAPYAWPFSDAVMEKAFPLYTSQQRTDAVTRSQANAGKVVEYLTLADLYRSASGNDKQLELYIAKARDFEERAANILKMLEAGIENTARLAQESSASSRFSGTIEVEPSCHYRRGEWCEDRCFD